MGPAQPPNQFEVARKRASQQESANLQGQQDAIKRRMAAQGGGPSGAMVKLETQASDASAKRLAEANEGIDVAEHAENRRVAEIKEGRDFQRSEREAGQTFSRGERMGSQEFAALQAEAQRKYQTGERLSSQEFAALEAGKQRGFMTSEREAGQKYATGERMGSQGFQAEQALAARKQQQQQFDKQYRLQENAAAFDQNFRNRAFDQEQKNWQQTFNMSGDQFAWQKYIDEKNLGLANRIQRANENDPGLLGGIFGGLAGGLSPGPRSGGSVGSSARRTLNPFA